MDAITASLRRFGMRQPIVVQKSGDSMIVRAGNGRLAVAKQLGWTHLPAVVYEEKDDEAVAYAIADNRTAELAEWDWEALTEAFEDIGEPELLSSIGFSEKELSFLTIGSSTSSLTDEESGADATDSRKSSSKEVDLTEFTDAAFDHTCPRCKFSFND